MSPENSLLGATIETNRDTSNLSKAPSPVEKFEAMPELSHHHKFVVVEPILDFDLLVFAEWMRRLNPIHIYIGYDNYGKRLPEPPLKKTLKLVRELEKVAEVRSKTLRKAWYER